MKKIFKHLDTKQYLAISVRNGLGNRLRSLFSYKLISDYLQIPLYLHWGPSAGFDETKLEDLIDISNLNIHLINEKTFNTLRNNSFKIDENIDNVYKDDTDPNPSTSKFFQSQKGLIKKTQHEEFVGNILKGVYPKLSVISTNFMPWAFYPSTLNRLFPDWEKEYLSNLSGIKFSKKILSLVDDSLQSFTSNTYGLHIRRGDGSSPLNPNKEKYLESSIELYFQIIDQALGANFYLSTDCEETLNIFKEKYGDKVLHIEKTFSPNAFGEPKGGQLDAMAELYLLSKTKGVFGNFFSTFSRLSSELNSIPFSIVKRGEDYLNFSKPKGTTLINCCMNRNNNLSIALNTWLNVEGLDEIIIVDWSSDNHVINLIPEDTRGKVVKVVRAEDQGRWILSWAFNLAASQVSYDKILKIDADVLLQPNFLKSNPLQPNSFSHGSWKVAKDENEKHLNGQMYCYTKDFESVNGYHEKITSYGWDDDDLYDRFKDINLKENIFSTDQLYHLPTPETQRSQHQSEFKNISEANLKDTLFAEIMKNKQFAKENPWLPTDEKKQWDIKEAGENYFIAKMVDI